MKESGQLSGLSNLPGSLAPEVSRRAPSGQIILEIHNSPFIAGESFRHDWNIVCIAGSGVCEFTLESDADDVKCRRFLPDHGRVLIIPGNLQISDLCIRTQGELVVVGFLHEYLYETAAALKYSEFESFELEFRQDRTVSRMAGYLSGNESLNSIRSDSLKSLPRHSLIIS